MLQIKLQTSEIKELCESRGGHPGLSVLTSLMVSVDVQQHRTVLTHWSQLVTNMSTDIRGHQATREEEEQTHSEVRSCVKVEVAVLGFPS